MGNHWFKEGWYFIPSVDEDGDHTWPRYHIIEAPSAEEAADRIRALGCKLRHDEQEVEGAEASWFTDDGYKYSDAEEGEVTFHITFHFDDGREIQTAVVRNQKNGLYFDELVNTYERYYWNK